MGFSNVTKLNQRARAAGGMKLAVALLTSVGLFAMVAQDAGRSADLKRAADLYERTDYAGALRILKQVNPPDGAALELMGESSLMQGDFRKATDYLEKAVALDPRNSDYVLWLGRAWGRRAETATPFTAPVYAGRARDCFEKAVQLNPRNEEALSDLFNYYLEAPGFLGGGSAKAQAIADRLQQIDPAEAHLALAQMASKRKQVGETEAQLRRAVQLAPRSVGRVIALAKFLAREGRVNESEAVLAQADSISPNNPRVMFERANIYVESHRNLDQARELLKRYLESNLTPDDPPREKAQELLRRVAGA